MRRREQICPQESPCGPAFLGLNELLTEAARNVADELRGHKDIKYLPHGPLATGAAQHREVKPVSNRVWLKHVEVGTDSTKSRPWPIPVEVIANQAHRLLEREGNISDTEPDRASPEDRPSRRIAADRPFQVQSPPACRSVVLQFNWRSASNPNHLNPVLPLNPIEEAAGEVVVAKGLRSFLCEWPRLRMCELGGHYAFRTISERTRPRRLLGALRRSQTNSSSSNRRALNSEMRSVAFSSLSASSTLAPRIPSRSSSG